jgi:acetoin utilization deacetylase AcuC-like enzyme
MVSTRAREHCVGWFAGSPYPWVAMGGGGYDLDVVRRVWSMEYLIMLGAPVPPDLHDAEPPVAEDGMRSFVDTAVDRSIGDALAAAFA